MSRTVVLYSRESSTQYMCATALDCLASRPEQAACTRRYPRLYCTAEIAEVLQYRTAATSCSLYAVRYTVPSPAERPVPDPIRSRVPRRSDFRTYPDPISEKYLVQSTDYTTVGESTVQSTTAVVAYICIDGDSPS